MRKVVLDTNILVSALWSKKGNPYEIVEMVFSFEITPCYNNEIIEEYYEVLLREKLCFPKNEVLCLLHEITKNGFFADHIESDTLFVDESDRKFYDTAKVNEAILITGNTKHYPNEPFVMTPDFFLKHWRTSF